MGGEALITTRATVLYDTPGPKAQRFNRTPTWIVIAIIVTILAWAGMKLADKGQFESNKWSFFLESITWTTYILPGLVSTIIAAVVSIVLALVRWLCSVIIEFFRAIPVLVLMLFAYSVFAIWQLFPSGCLDFAAVVSGLTMYSGSVIDETLRSGIKSLPKSQRGAMITLGLSHRQAMVTTLLPQAAVAMLPTTISQMAIALKDSTLDYMIGYVEVVRSDRQLGECYSAMTPSLVVVTIILIAVNFGLANLAEHIKSQLHAGRARRNVIAKIPHQRDMGITTKDEVNVDWHAEGHRDLRGTHE